VIATLNLRGAMRGSYRGLESCADDLQCQRNNRVDRLDKQDELSQQV